MGSRNKECAEDVTATLFKNLDIHIYGFLAKNLALAGLNLQPQLSDRIIHFSALNSVHDRKLGKKGQWH